METMELMVSDWWQGSESLWERIDSERATMKPRNFFFFFNRFFFFSFNFEIKKKKENSNRSS